MVLVRLITRQIEIAISPKGMAQATKGEIWVIKGDCANWYLNLPKSKSLLMAAYKNRKTNKDAMISKIVFFLFMNVCERLVEKTKGRMRISCLEGAFKDEYTIRRQMYRTHHDFLLLKV